MRTPELTFSVELVPMDSDDQLKEQFAFARHSRQFTRAIIHYLGTRKHGYGKPWSAGSPAVWFKERSLGVGFRLAGLVSDELVKRVGARGLITVNGRDPLDILADLQPMVINAVYRLKSSRKLVRHDCIADIRRDLERGYADALGCANEAS